MSIDYTLAILTHGDARTLGRTLQSFTEHVTPAPSHIRVFADGMDGHVYDTVIQQVTNAFPLVDDRRFVATGRDRQAGFCQATWRLWKQCSGARAPEADYVFWLEHDFVFMRNVDLTRLARLLRHDPQLAQVSLIRDAVNAREAHAGGLVASRPGEFSAHRNDIADYMLHDSYFTTNPSLMRRAFMAENEFFYGSEQCEGRFGLALRERGYRFAAWGLGEEWVAHMGVRDGTGVGY